MSSSRHFLLLVFMYAIVSLHAVKIINKLNKPISIFPLSFFNHNGRSALPCDLGPGVSWQDARVASFQIIQKESFTSRVIIIDDASIKFIIDNEFLLTMIN